MLCQLLLLLLCGTALLIVTTTTILIILIILIILTILVVLVVISAAILSATLCETWLFWGRMTWKSRFGEKKRVLVSKVNVCQRDVNKYLKTERQFLSYDLHCWCILHCCCCYCFGYFLRWRVAEVPIFRICCVNYAYHYYCYYFDCYYCCCCLCLSGFAGGCCSYCCLCGCC